MNSIWSDRERVDREIQTVEYVQLEYDPDWGCYLSQEVPFTGFCVQRFPDGTLENVVQLQQGINHGVTVVWFSDGGMQLYRELQAGVLHGECIEWGEDGGKIVDEHYHEGRLIEA